MTKDQTALIVQLLVELRRNLEQRIDDEKKLKEPNAELIQASHEELALVNETLIAFMELRIGDLTDNIA
jgi:hypothetical protein